jgi:transposase
MAYKYLAVDRDQTFMLPPSMRDWLPDSELVWFILDAVKLMNLKKFYGHLPRPRPAGKVKDAGDEALFSPPEPTERPAPLGGDPRGRAAYDPAMMVGLVLYAYAIGVRSSRRIEAACRRNVDFRIVAANHIVDHTTIARFRARYAKELAGLFVDVLTLCREAGLGKLGVVALDGTKIAASASMGANRSRAAIEAEVAKIMDEAADTDTEEDALFGAGRGDELPDYLADPHSRLDNLRNAKARLDAEREAARQAATEAEAPHAEERAKTAAKQRIARPRSGTKRPLSVPRAKADLKIAEEQATRLAHEREQAERTATEEGRKLQGRKPTFGRRVEQAKQELERAEALENEQTQAQTINVTDPDSVLLSSRNGFVQGYNPQVVVTEDQIILGVQVTRFQNDVNQFVPMVALTEANLGAAGFTEQIGTVTADAGYASRANFEAPGPKRLINPTRSWKLHRRRKREGYVQGPPPDGATPAEVMEHLLLTEEGAKIYAKRCQTIETVFGQLKEAQGFRRFSRRGLEAANDELLLVAATHNLRKLFARKGALVAAAP